MPNITTMSCDRVQMLLDSSWPLAPAHAPPRAPMDPHNGVFVGGVKGPRITARDARDSTVRNQWKCQATFLPRVIHDRNITFWHCCQLQDHQHLIRWSARMRSNHRSWLKLDCNFFLKPPTMTKYHQQWIYRTKHNNNTHYVSIITTKHNNTMSCNIHSNNNNKHKHCNKYVINIAINPSQHMST